MAVQPIFPEPISVKGSVSEAPHSSRLVFIRRTIALHLASVLVVGGSAAFDPGISAVQALGLFLTGLVALTLVRRTASGARWDHWVSSILLLPTLVALGILIGELGRTSEPVWTLAVAYGLWVAYTPVAGRDFSFVGQVEVAVIGMAVVLLASVGLSVLDWKDALLWFLICFASLFFLSYNLAALMRRRLRHEYVVACSDMYRDLLNFITYSFRIVQHWRRFRPIRL